MYTQYYPYASGSEYTASYAVSASFATSASLIASASSSIFAESVLSPVSGAAATVNICIITYQQYLTLLNNPTAIEDCSPPL